MAGQCADRSASPSTRPGCDCRRRRPKAGTRGRAGSTATSSRRPPGSTTSRCSPLNDRFDMTMREYPVGAASARALPLRPHRVEGRAIEHDEWVRRRPEARRRAVLRERADVGDHARLAERPAVVIGNRRHDGVGLLKVRIGESPPDHDDAPGAGIDRDVGRLVDALGLAQRGGRVPAVAVVGRSGVDDLGAVLLAVAREHGIAHMDDARRHLLNASLRRLGRRGVRDGEVVGAACRQQRYRGYRLVEEPSGLTR